MSFIQSIIVLIIILCINLLINRIATVALVFTGMSRDMARFQARSAFCTVGFTTAEAESIAQHPLRRRIIMILMLAGNIGFVGIVVTAVNSLGVSSTLPSVGKFLLLVGSLAVLLIIGSSKWIDDLLFRIISWALERFSSLEIYDYHTLLRVQEGYYVTKLQVSESGWLAGRCLNELRLSDMGINILGINRADGSYVGSPVGDDTIRKNDTLIVYGTRENIEYIDRIRSKAEGWQQHREILDAKEDYTRTHPGIEACSTIFQVHIEEDFWLAGRTLSSLGEPEDGLVVLAVEHKDGNYELAPAVHYTILPGDRLFCLGHSTLLNAVKDSTDYDTYQESLQKYRGANKRQREEKESIAGTSIESSES